MKTTLTSLLICLFIVTSYAQREVKFGVQLSPTFSWMNTSYTKINPNGTNLGLKLGMIGEYFFNAGDEYSLVTGIGFHFNAGGTLFYESTIDTVSIWTEANIPGDNVYEGETSFKYSLQYVEIPFGLKLRTRDFGHIRYYVEPHMALGFRTQARGNIENDAAIDPEEAYNIQTGVNLFNLSWGIGGGVEYSLSESTSLFGGLGFQSGFADVTKDKKTTLVSNERTSQDDSKGKIHGLSIRIGIIF